MYRNFSAYRFMSYPESCSDFLWQCTRGVAPNSCRGNVAHTIFTMRRRSFYDHTISLLFLWCFFFFIHSAYQGCGHPKWLNVKQLFFLWSYFDFFDFFMHFFRPAIWEETTLKVSAMLIWAEIKISLNSLVWIVRCRSYNCCIRKPPSKKHKKKKSKKPAHQRIFRLSIS